MAVTLSRPSGRSESYTSLIGFNTPQLKVPKLPRNVPWFSLRFNCYFSRWTWVSQYQNVSILDFVGAKVIEVVSGDNWSYKSCKAPVKSSPPTNQHQVFLQAGCPACCPTNNVKALKGKISHSMDLLTPSSPEGLPTLSFFDLFVCPILLCFPGQLSNLPYSFWC